MQNEDSDDDDQDFDDRFEALANEDREIDQFKERMSMRWGEEESKLRMAVFISFVNNADQLKFRKKAKAAR